MLYLRSINRFIFISLALLSMSVSSAIASIFNYEYSGQTYDNLALSPYNSSMTITASFSFDLATIANLAYAERKADLTSYSVFDGVQALDSSNSTFTTAQFRTDSSGSISKWAFKLLSGSNSSVVGIRSESGCYDIVIGLACSNQGPGTFTGPSAVPVPAAVWLFGTGLLGLIGFSKRRKAA